MPFARADDKVRIYSNRDQPEAWSSRTVVESIAGCDRQARG